jgi:hypothetical protein
MSNALDLTDKDIGNLLDSVGVKVQAARTSGSFSGVRGWSADPAKK